MIFEGMIRKTKTKNSKKPPQLFKVSSHVTLAFSSNSRKKINATFLLVNDINGRNVIERCTPSGPQKCITKDSFGIHNHSTLLTMSELTIF